MEVDPEPRRSTSPESISHRVSNHDDGRSVVSDENPQDLNGHSRRNSSESIGHTVYVPDERKDGSGKVPKQNGSIVIAEDVDNPEEEEEEKVPERTTKKTQRAKKSAQSPPNDVPQTEDKPRYKSYRKKYRKMRIMFEESMGTATDLFRGERKLQDIVKRLRDQNDQLLEILLELNETKRIPGLLTELGRYDLSTSAPSSEVIKSKNKSLSALEHDVTHTLEGLTDPHYLPDDFEEGSLPPSYIPQEEEDEFLGKLDSTVAAPYAHEVERGLAGYISCKEWIHQRTEPIEHDFAIESPISVHNWLRRNQPQNYDVHGNLVSHTKDGKPDKEKDKDSEKGSARSPPPSRSKSRKDRASVKNEQAFDSMDDEFEIETPPESGVGLGSSKKRKRDDEAYRPKGGHNRSSKSKRKRERGEEGEGRSSGKKRKLDEKGLSDDIDFAILKGVGKRS